MLIVCEGTDGGGKSTAVRNLRKTFEFLTEDLENPPTVTMIHKGQPIPGLDAFQEYELPLEQPELNRKIRSDRDLVLLDRWHAGEIIYGQLYRNHSRLTPGGMLHVEMLLSALGAVKVMSQPMDPKVVRQRLEDRGDDFLRFEHIETVHAWYERHALTYGYRRGGSHSPSVLLEMAKATSRDANGPSICDWPGYVGDPEPSTLLVGDRRNDGSRARLEFPRAFTPWDSAGSATYLMSALVAADMHRHVGIVNANEDGVDLKAIHDLPHEVHVVALGRHASKELTAAEVSHETVPHPQWQRRFRHSHMAEYAAMIKEAAGWK